MKRVAFGFAALLSIVGTSQAAEPGKTTDAAAGKVYANAAGMTLYTSDKDAAGARRCYDACAEMRPPFKADATGKAARDWTFIVRKGGVRMSAYERKPLYTQSKDKKPGDAMGDGVGGVWRAAHWRIESRPLKRGRATGFETRGRTPQADQSPTPRRRERRLKIRP
jgi:predicted lipoprotein with Yx(FWY)xxD motif